MVGKNQPEIKKNGQKIQSFYRKNGLVFFFFTNKKSKKTTTRFKVL